MGLSSFEGGSEDTYARYANIYDALFGDLHDDVAFYVRRVGAPDGRVHVLELGAGTGRVTERLLEAGHRVTAVDSSPEMLAKAQARLARFGERALLVRADVARLALDAGYTHAFAPYGMIAHLVHDEDRRSTFKGVFEHLAPGGWFVFDDRPSWLAGRADGTDLLHLRTRRDPVSGEDVRLSTSCVDLDDPPVTIRHDFIDWMTGDRVTRRVVVRVVLRNVPLEADLALLREIGFRDFELLGDFGGAAFDRERLATNSRLIVACRRPG